MIASSYCLSVVTYDSFGCLWLSVGRGFEATPAIRTAASATVRSIACEFGFPLDRAEWRLTGRGKAKSGSFTPEIKSQLMVALMESLLDPKFTFIVLRTCRPLILHLVLLACEKASRSNGSCMLQVVSTLSKLLSLVPEAAGLVLELMCKSTSIVDYLMALQPGLPLSQVRGLCDALGANSQGVSTQRRWYWSSRALHIDFSAFSRPLTGSTLNYHGTGLPFMPFFITRMKKLDGTPPRPSPFLVGIAQHLLKVLSRLFARQKPISTI